MIDTTTYGKDIDLTELQPAGIKFSAIVGTGGVVQGKPVMWDGSSANTVVACTGTSNIAVGIAAETQATVGGVVKVLGPGCLVRVPYTLTVGGKVGISTADLGDYSTGTCLGTTVTSASSASVIRVAIQY